MIGFVFRILPRRLVVRRSSCTGNLRRLLTEVSRPAVVLGLAICFAQMAFGQSGDVVGRVEAGGFLGGSFGEDPAFLPESGTAWSTMGGGNVLVKVKDNETILPYFEMSTFPGLVRRLTNDLDGASVVTANVDASVFDLNGGVHLRRTIAESPIVPYGVVGFGVLYSRIEGSGTLQTGSGDILTFPIRKQSSTQSAVNFGAGLRYTISQRLGFRFEFKAYQPIGGEDTHIFGRFAAGFYYRWN